MTVLESLFIMNAVDSVVLSELFGVGLVTSVGVTGPGGLVVSVIKD